MIDKPGPELDKQIAYKLFNAQIIRMENEQDYRNGWYLIVIGPSMDRKLPAAYTSTERKWQSAIWAATEEKAWALLPEYSTKWSGMQLVVEEMQRRGWEYVIESEGTDKHHARFFKTYEGDYGEYNGATKAPFAVCMAALKALEDSQNE
jgi:hypothetical protein